MNNVGGNIRKRREAKGVTQDEMAQSLNVTRQAVSNWECGKTQPDIDTLNAIAVFLDTSVEELIYGFTRNYVTNITKNIGNGAKTGVGIGAVLAIVISYVKWQSIGWALLHGLLNWIYVIYYIIKYGWS